MLPRLHLITDDAVLASPGFLDGARWVLREQGAGVALHLRGHGTSAGILYELARALVAEARETGGWVLVNDRVDVALAVGAAGVQLGRRSIPVRAARDVLGAGARIGYSAHDPDEAAAARRDGADFIVLGAIWETASHPGERPAGLELLRAATARAAAPIIAIGGVTPERVAEAVATGAYGVAVLGGVWRAADPAAAAAAYREALQAAEGRCATSRTA